MPKINVLKKEADIKIGTEFTRSADVNVYDIFFSRGGKIRGISI